MPPRRGEKDFYSYDTAQICVNGHVVNLSYHDGPQFRRDFCVDCGARTIITCPSCNTEIVGHYRNHTGLEPPMTPRFCTACGRPYPWIHARIAAAKAMADELDGLSDAERITIKASIDDIAADTPMTEVAVVRVKKLIPKVLAGGGEALRRLIVDVASETASKTLKGQ